MDFAQFLKPDVKVFIVLNIERPDVSDLLTQHLLGIILNLILRRI